MKLVAFILLIDSLVLMGSVCTVLDVSFWEVIGLSLTVVMAWLGGTLWRME